MAEAGGAVVTKAVVVVGGAMVVAAMVEVEREGGALAGAALEVESMAAVALVPAETGVVASVAL